MPLGGEAERANLTTSFLNCARIFAFQIVGSTRREKKDLYSMKGVKIEWHIAYTNDMILFCKANRKSLLRLKNVLNW